MWMTSIIDNERLQSVVFILSDTLRSILEDGETLQERRCAPPVIEAKATCEDIVSRLDDFRNDVKEIRSREAIMIAKLSRAREWAQMLKDMAPEIKPEISVFLLGTVFCKDLQQAVSPDPQRSFHGGNHARQFLSERLKSEPVRTGKGDDASVKLAYMVAGKVRIEYLLSTCERFLDTLDEYFSLYSEDALELEEPLALDDDVAELELLEAAEAGRADNVTSGASVSVH